MPVIKKMDPGVHHRGPIYNFAAEFLLFLLRHCF